MTEQVHIHEFKPLQDHSGARIIDGFPSVGLVSTIAANYLIDMLRLKQIGTIEGDAFPSLSVVHDGEPLSPARVYAGTQEHDGRKEKLVVFVSEFQPSPALVRPIANAILAWAKEKNAAFVVSPEGLVLEGPEAEDDKVDVYAIGSTPKMQEFIRAQKLRTFSKGIITGVSGVLLNAGKREGQDVVSVLCEAHANYPDARSAAMVIEVVSKLIGVKVDVKPLIAQAEEFERQLKRLQAQAASKQATGVTRPSMYG